MLSEDGGDEGDSPSSFIYSNCPFIKKRKLERNVVFSEEITEYCVTYSEPSNSLVEEHIYEEPCKYSFWPNNKHFFSRQIWQALKR